ncbi:TRAP transporter large permease [Geminicoccaceae bacterium 1502E]|nr:TRAP transporter large permease [Geminicoccaceae bacterium 1502E]
MTTLFLAAFAVLLVLGVPIAYAMVASSVLFIWIENFPLSIMAQRFASGVQSFPLLAIPLFILAGTLMNESGISARMFSFTRALIGHISGGLAYVNVLANTLMAGISGSSLADCAATTRVFVPQMVKAGFGRGFSVSLTAASATLAPLIPPSILMVVYGWQANISIGDLFIAGVLPGLFVGLALLATCGVIARRRGFPRDEAFSAVRLWREFKGAFWALLMPVLVVGGFRVGAFTATEVAAMAAAYSLFVGLFIYRTLSMRQFVDALIGTGKETAAILILVAAASPFAWLLGLNQAPQQMLAAISSITSEPWAILLILNVLLLVLGMFMETLAIIIILVPILMPLLQAAGVDLVHFGIIMIFNLLIGQLTPPVGVLMFVACSISRITLGQFVRAGWPIILVMFGALLVITYWPGLSLYLPRLLAY